MAEIEEAHQAWVFLGEWLKGDEDRAALTMISVKRRERLLSTLKKCMIQREVASNKLYDTFHEFKSLAQRGSVCY